ncbi:Arc family DNA-binding protein (plasmid) [Stutzerimonas degradans]|nr:Arc family DNA-binding protein [Stutzerimonas degradans]
MTTISRTVRNPIAQAALSRALQKDQASPAPMPKYNSRTAEKFVIRGFHELFDQLALIGRHHGRSMNSEAVAAILDALNGNVRTETLLTLLRAGLGKEVSAQVLSNVPTFRLSACTTAFKFVVRFPPNVRESIRDGLAMAQSDAPSMNQWLLDVLVHWINMQRQQYALVTAAIALEDSRLVHAHPLATGNPCQEVV